VAGSAHGVLAMEPPGGDQVRRRRNPSQVAALMTAAVGLLRKRCLVARPYFLARLQFLTRR
jgi:hypothetical protein